MVSPARKSTVASTTPKSVSPAYNLIPPSAGVCPPAGRAHGVVNVLRAGMNAASSTSGAGVVGVPSSTNPPSSSRGGCCSRGSWCGCGAWCCRCCWV
ncbi:hypothetical protein SUGI_0097040 [Cryptomeria japonica]|nr:hypothetical protein SUGI_0097040 [Cryptomeria japonica]